MESEQADLPATGWYDDPDGRSGVKRYWDGEQWTDRYEDLNRTVASKVGEIDRSFKSLHTIAGIFTALGWLTLILGSLAVIGAAISAGAADETTTTVFGETQRTEPAANAAVIAIAGGLGVLLYTLVFFAAAAFTRLWLRVEGQHIPDRGRDRADDRSKVLRPVSS